MHAVHTANQAWVKALCPMGRKGRTAVLCGEILQQTKGPAIRYTLAASRVSPGRVRPSLRLLVTARACPPLFGRRRRPLRFRPVLRALDRRSLPLRLLWPPSTFHHRPAHPRYPRHRRCCCRRRAVAVAVAGRGRGGCSRGGASAFGAMRHVHRGRDCRYRDRSVAEVSREAAAAVVPSFCFSPAAPVAAATTTATAAGRPAGGRASVSCMSKSCRIFRPSVHSVDSWGSRGEEREPSVLRSGESQTWPQTDSAVNSFLPLACVEHTMESMTRTRKNENQIFPPKNIHAPRCFTIAPSAASSPTPPPTTSTRSNEQPSPMDDPPKKHRKKPMHPPTHLSLQRPDALVVLRAPPSLSKIAGVRWVAFVHRIAMQHALRTVSPRRMSFFRPSPSRPGRWWACWAPSFSHGRLFSAAAMSESLGSRRERPRVPSQGWAAFALLPWAMSRSYTVPRCTHAKEKSAPFLLAQNSVYPATGQLAGGRTRYLVLHDEVLGSFRRP